jgi:hypothetical protein
VPIINNPHHTSVAIRTQEPKQTTTTGFRGKRRQVPGATLRSPGRATILTELRGFSPVALHRLSDAAVAESKELTMTTILITNAVSLLLASVGIGAFLRRKNRRAAVQVLYVTTKTSPPRG